MIDEEEIAAAKDKLLKKFFANDRPEWIEDEVEDFGSHLEAPKKMRELFGCADY